MVTAIDADAVSRAREQVHSISRRMQPVGFNWRPFAITLDVAILGEEAIPDLVIIEAIDLSTSLRFHKDTFPPAYDMHIDDLQSAFAGRRVCLIQLGFNNAIQVLQGPGPLSGARRFMTEEFDYRDDNPKSILRAGTRITSVIELIASAASYIRLLGYHGEIRTALMTDGWNRPVPADLCWEQESAYQAWQGLLALSSLTVSFDLFAFVDRTGVSKLEALNQKLHVTPERLHIMTVEGASAWNQLQQMMDRVTGAITGEGKPPPG